MRYHLISSDLLLKSAIMIEQKTGSLECSEKDAYVAYSSSSIISSIASVEANINELLNYNKTCIDSSEYLHSQELIGKYEWYKPETSMIEQLKFKSSIFSKYDIFAFLKTGNFITHNMEKENIEYAISIRNALVHFTPEREDQLINHKKIINSRKNRFKLSSIYEEEHITFPQRFMCADCAKWCRKTASSFIDSFNSTYSS